MRKFVVKNRQKRKYVKKLKQVHTFSFSKTISGMMPIIIMFVAFMATMIISSSFRSALTQIHFNFEFPAISFRNPIIAIQTIAQDSMQLGITFWTTIITSTFYLLKTLQNSGNSVINLTKFLDPLSFLGAVEHSTLFVVSFLRNFFWTIFVFLEKGIAIYTSTLTQTKIVLVSWILSELKIVIVVLVNISSIVSLGTLSALTTLWQMTTATIAFFVTFVINAVTMISNAIVSLIDLLIHVTITLFSLTVFAAEFIGNIIFFVMITVVHFLLIALLAIWSGIVFAWTVIVATISRICEAILHFVEIPFKILYAFWLLIRPYAMIFDRHVQMTGGDFSNGLDSMGKVGSIINAKH